MGNKFWIGLGLLWSSVLYAILAALSGSTTWFALPPMFGGTAVAIWDLWQQHKKIKKLESETAALEAEFRKKMWGTSGDF